MNTPYASISELTQDCSYTVTEGPPDIHIKSGSQKHVLYERLKVRPIMNYEIREVTGSLNHTRRISELRKQLEAQGWTIEARKGASRGAWLYCLVKVPAWAKTPGPGRFSRFVGMLKGLVGGKMKAQGIEKPAWRERARHPEIPNVPKRADD